MLWKPFTLMPDGYYVYASSGSEQKKGGEKLPKWRQSAKEGYFARTHRRLHPHSRASG